MVLCNLVDDFQCQDMKQSVLETFGPIDILINCAGAIFPGDIEN